MQEKRSGRVRVSSFALVIACLLFDALAPFALARFPTQFAMLMGAESIVIAQTWLLAVWASLGPQPWLRRIALALLLAPLGVGLFEHGLIYVAKFGYTPGIRQMLVAPLELMVLAVPLFVMRTWRGWRMAPTDGSGRHPPQRFSLRQLLATTAIFAALIPVAQLGVEESALIVPATDLRVRMLVGACLDCFLLSWVAVVPLTWLCTRLQGYRAGAAVLVVCAVANGASLAAVRHYLSGQQLDEGMGALALVDGVFFGFCGGLLLLRYSSCNSAKPDPIRGAFLQE